jgi:ABC-type transport system substrate-binding protein
MKRRLPWLASCLLLCTISNTAMLAGETPIVTPRRGGTLHLASPSEIRSLDPAIAYDTFSWPLVRLLFGKLLDYDDATGLVTAQAKDWNISPDGRTYIFHLRPGVRFANGREVEAADYVFAFERVLSPKTGSPGQTFFLDIKGAREFVDGKAAHVSGLRAPDKATLIIELKEPRFTFRYVLAMPFASAVPREVVQQYGTEFQYHLTGSGPYRLAEWRRGIFWRLERNPYYSGSDGFVDAVEIMIGGDDATLTMMLERGELDQVAPSPAQAIRFKRDARLRSWLTRVDVVDTDYLFMNTEMKPFDDVRVRRAINYAINRERLPKLAGGFATVAHGVVPPAMPWSNPDLPRYEFDPEKARALLREAGYPDGFKTELWCQADAPIFMRMAEGIQQDLRQIGIQAELKPANFAAYLEKSGTRHQVPCERITDTECNNNAFYNNPDVNRCLDAAVKSMNPDERTRLFWQAENLIMQGAPWAPLIHEQLPVLYHPRVHGAGPHPVWLYRYERMWLDP